MLFFLYFALGFILGCCALIFFRPSKNQYQLSQFKAEKERLQQELDSQRENYEEKIRWRDKGWTEQLNDQKTHNENLEKKLSHLTEKTEDGIKRSSSLEKENEQFKKELGAQKERFEEQIREKEKNFSERMASQQKLYKELEEKSKQLTEKTKLDFQNIANKIVSENRKSFGEESTKSLSQILSPFRDDIESFKKSIQTFDSKGKFLDETLKDFKNINTQMRDGAKELTQALRGDIKAQGQWGEFVLANILEKSGLREGEEFIIQGKGLKDDAGNFMRPDVIVKLPDNKHIVIDSKVSFSHDYHSLHTKEQKEEALKKILHSLRSHIESLSSKKYTSSADLQTPDFTLMFVPNEGVFSLVTQTADLFEQAWKKSIVIVSPTTLYASLRTIASIWKIEKYNKNAKEIAKRGGALYDKFAGFLKDMGSIGGSLNKARDSYDAAMGKLQTGQGNLLRRAEQLKKLEQKQSAKSSQVLNSDRNDQDTKWQSSINSKKTTAEEFDNSIAEAVHDLKELGVENNKEMPSDFETKIK